MRCMKQTQAQASAAGCPMWVTHCQDGIPRMLWQRTWGDELQSNTSVLGGGEAAALEGLYSSMVEP